MTDDGPLAPAGLDPAAWSKDVTELFAQRSCLVRLGAHFIAADEPLSLVAVGGGGPPAYVDLAEPDPETGVPAEASSRTLFPDRCELAWTVVVPDGLARELDRQPERGRGLKEDIADRLAFVADQAFLTGGPAPDRPLGIARRQTTGEVGVAALGADLLYMLVETGRLDQDETPGRAGWIIDPATFVTIARLEQGGRSWESTGLLEHDGTGTGLLLGYPFVVTAAVAPADAASELRLYFAADWGEAWIAAGGGGVRVDISADERSTSGETVIRAVLRHDFELRRSGRFFHALLP